MFRGLRATLAAVETRGLLVATGCGDSGATGPAEATRSSTVDSGNQVAPSIECYLAFHTGIVCASGTSGAGVDTGLFLLCVGD